LVFEAKLDGFADVDQGLVPRVALADTAWNHRTLDDKTAIL
jgi:hypothetical protein